MNFQELHKAVLAADNLSNQLMLIQQSVRFATPERLNMIDELLTITRAAFQSMTCPFLSEKHIHILRHSLGLTQSQQAYRNHFCTGHGSKDFEFCEQLVADGLMERRDPSELSGGDYTYVVTEKGKQHAEVKT